MSRRIDSEPRGGDPEHIVAQFRLLGIIEEPTQVAVDTVIADHLRVMNIEGEHTEAQAVADLLIHNPLVGILRAVDIAREFDLLHGSSVLPIVEAHLRAFNRSAQSE